MAKKKKNNARQNAKKAMITIDRRIGPSMTHTEFGIDSLCLKQENKIIFDEIYEMIGPIKGSK